MARARVIQAGESGTFHCIVRCVRRAFLCGEDPVTGKNFEHRREWIRARMAHLSQAFSIEILTYAVMSNHVHGVLRVQAENAQKWSDEEVARRWLSVYTPRHKVNDTVHRIIWESDVERLCKDPARLAVLRKRLTDLSWYMKALNEYVARKANQEDKCKGRFWESRFKCQRLEDEAAILACMSYVDLNPVRAGIAESLETSIYTGVHDRIEAQKMAQRIQPQRPPEKQMTPSASSPIIPRAQMLVNLNGESRPFHAIDELDYLTIVDWTGRQLRSDKPGYINKDIRPLLEDLSLNPEEWVHTIATYRTLFSQFAGTMQHLRKVAHHLGQSWVKGCQRAQWMFIQSESPAYTTTVESTT